MHSSTSNLGFSNLYETYSKVALSFKSSIGKMLLNTLSKPFVSSAASASKLVSILLARSEKMSSLPEENSETQPKE